MTCLNCLFKFGKPRCRLDVSVYVLKYAEMCVLKCVPFPARKSIKPNDVLTSAHTLNALQMYLLKIVILKHFE